MTFFKRIYYSLCERIYSVGKSGHERNSLRKLRLGITISDNSILYPESRILNFANDRSKIVIGSNCHVYGSLAVYPKAGSITIGDNSSIGELSRIVSGFRIHIGSRVMIAHNVNVLDNNSHPIEANLRHEDFMDAYSKGMSDYDLSGKEILIEDDVWIGFNCIVLKGVTIGRGAIIGAGSVVTKDVAPWTVNVGNPLRCVAVLDPVNF